MIRHQIYFYDGTLRRTSARRRADRLTILRAPVFDGPLVSCLMVTRGSPALVAAAMASFQSQSYRSIELVIVVQDASDELRQLVASDPRTRLVEAEPGLSLGALRNISVAAASGEIVCQWDDDDLYGPHRIARGVATLLETDADAVFLRQWLLWAPAIEQLRLAQSRVWEGSMLARRAALPRYPELRRRDDTRLVIAMGPLRIALLDDPLSYCYCIHGSNTYPDTHMRRLLDDAPVQLDYRAGLAGLAEYLPFAGHPALSAAQRVLLAGDRGAIAALAPLMRHISLRQGLKKLQWRLASLLKPRQG